MRLVALIAILVVLGAGGGWLYRSFFRSADSLMPEVTALADHFTRTGIEVRPYAVRHGYKYSEVLASAAFKIDGYPLPVAIELCPSEITATALLHAIELSPNLTHPHRNGRLVMNLPMWGDGTDEMAAKVVDAFTSFKPKPILSFAFEYRPKRA